MICTGLVKMLYDKAKKREVIDIRIGTGYTAVVLDNGKCGLAYTYRSGSSGECGLLKEAGELTGKKASELIHFYPSHNSIKASIGLATINAIVNYDLPGKIEGDVLEAIDISSGDMVGMIGYFAPLIKELEKKTDNIFIFEKKDIKEKYIVSEQEKEKILPNCNVVLLTSTTLVNKTFEPLIELIKNAGNCVLLGPSTPLVPEFFKDKGIHMLSGVEIIDVHNILKVVGQAGGMQSFKKYIRKINIRC